MSRSSSLPNFFKIGYLDGFLDKVAEEPTSPPNKSSIPGPADVFNRFSDSMGNFAARGFGNPEDISRNPFAPKTLREGARVLYDTEAKVSGNYGIDLKKVRDEFEKPPWWKRIGRRLASGSLNSAPSSYVGYGYDGYGYAGRTSMPIPTKPNAIGRVGDKYYLNPNSDPDKFKKRLGEFNSAIGVNLDVGQAKNLAKDLGGYIPFSRNAFEESMKKSMNDAIASGDTERFKRLAHMIRNDEISKKQFIAQVQSKAEEKTKDFVNKWGVPILAGGGLLTAMLLGRSSGANYIRPQSQNTPMSFPAYNTMLQNAKYRQLGNIQGASGLYTGERQNA